MKLVCIATGLVGGSKPWYNIKIKYLASTCLNISISLIFFSLVFPSPSIEFSSS